MTAWIVCGVLGLVAICSGIGFAVTAGRLRALTRRFATITDADEEAVRIVAAAKKKLLDAEAEAARIILAGREQIGGAEVEAARIEGAARANAESESSQIISSARKAQVDAEIEVARIIGTARQKIVDAEHESSRILATAQVTSVQLRAENAAELQRREALATDYAQAKQTFDRLSAEVRLLEENLEDISFGLYKPHYTFDTPEAFKRELDKINDKKKEMIRADQAVNFGVEWVVGGSAREGAKMQKQYAKLLLRAFNGECDAATAKVSWNNATKMEERIAKAFEAINKLGQVMQISIAPKYRDFQLAELRLDHELEEKKREVAEEQRSLRERMREEERVQREAEKMQSEAEAEEARFAKALDKARVELGKSKGDEHRRLTDKLLELEEKLAEAHSKTVRAKSLAELTKAGYVYVLSNVGSFGEGVFKIGLTRRLDPMDRVKELGDASVPFPFDVHAMVYSEDAPALENLMHKQYAERSVNLINMRKEWDPLESTCRHASLSIL